MEDTGVVLLQGDARAVLATLPAESVHCVVTSPPYWALRAYGTPPQFWGGDRECGHVWGNELANGRRGNRGISGTGGNLHPTLDAAGQGAGSGISGQFCSECDAWRGELGLEPTPDLFLAHIVEVFREVRRVLRKDGTCWVNFGDSYACSVNGRAAADVENDDRTFRNKPFGSAVAGLKPKDLVGMPWRVAFALQADGWWLRSDIIWSKANPMPESVTDRPTKSHEYLFLLAKSERYYYDADSIREKSSGLKGGRFGSYPAQTFRQDAGNPRPADDGQRNRRTVWEIATEPTPEAHFATFPQALVTPCILAGTSEAGVCAACGSPWVRQTEVSYQHVNHTKPREQSSYVASRGQVLNKQTRTTGWQPSCKCEAEVTPATVLDPFAGSGTTCLVATKLGRKSIGIELSEAYGDIFSKRNAQLGLYL